MDFNNGILKVIIIKITFGLYTSPDNLLSRRYDHISMFVYKYLR